MLEAERQPTVALSRARGAILVLVPVIVFLGLAGLRLLRRPELNFDEHIFLAAVAGRTGDRNRGHAQGIALAFWLVAVAYVLIRRGARAAAVIGLPAPIAFFAWLAYAALLDQHRLLATLGRWLGSTGGSSTIVDKRLHIGPRIWAKTVVTDIIGPLLIFAAGGTAALVATWRPRIPPIVAVPIVYIVIPSWPRS